MAAASAQVALPWLTWANEQAEKGINEGRDNDIIVGWAQDIGLDWFRSASTAWCMVFVNRALLAAGLKGTGTALARDTGKIGTKLRRPVVGALAYMARGNSSWQGHAMIVKSVSADGKTFTAVNGNVSNMVKVSTYRTADMLGFRWPEGAPMTADARAASMGAAADVVPGERLLVVGMSGADVELVQVDLKILGYMKNDPEIAHYGENTRLAVMEFQRDHGLYVDGKVGEATAPALYNAAREKEQKAKAESAAKKAATPAAAAGVGAGAVIAAAEPVMNTIDRAMKYNDGTKFGLYVALGILVAAGAILVWRYAVRRGAREGVSDTPVMGQAE
ncbi:peptidoglycan-binding protein [Acuticoccus sp. M5D2P5]|uniref:C40 family peptidase n=1 Tax=Acuticoccus kalidii TaxID=2910977 RepID=UPI001F2B3651|nr:peptidoglycan-binding protein [Acuticoccus kalidii]MCF3931837.1 peptidoglycan-binding protein [Acuticoccus kalidii]